MSSVSNSNPNPNLNLNPNPWTRKDCSQGICSLYCPQWCYIVYPPPPPSILLSDGDDDTSGFEFSPLIVAVIGILASTFILVTYYTIISRFCRHRRSTNDDGDSINELAQASSPASNSGLDEALIKSITVCKYNKSGGVVEGHDCSVCLSEFEENETLRLLPKCNHAFHLPCIDTWLKSHATCPLCRSTITVCPNPSMEPPPRIIVNALEHQQMSEHVVVVVESSEQQGRVASFGAHVMPKLAVEGGDSIEQRQGH